MLITVKDSDFREYHLTETLSVLIPRAGRGAARLIDRIGIGIDDGMGVYTSTPIARTDAAEWLRAFRYNRFSESKRWLAWVEGKAPRPTAPWD